MRVHHDKVWVMIVLGMENSCVEKKIEVRTNQQTEFGEA